MRRLSLIGLALLLTGTLAAQTKISRVDEILNAPRTEQQNLLDERLDSTVREWVTKSGIDSLDQKKIPKIVTMGVMFNANMSHFLITEKLPVGYKTTSSYLKAGMEVGGFMDFLVTRNFAIQARVIFTAEQNQFGIHSTTNHLWAFGMDIPVLFLYRLGNINQGFLNVGAGPFAHFTFASDRGYYQNNEAFTPTEEPAAYVALHDNHAGIMPYIGYEFPIGIQIGFNYMISLSDVFGYYKNAKGTPQANLAFYPQRMSLGIAYRWK